MEPAHLVIEYVSPTSCARDSNLGYQGLVLVPKKFCKIFQIPRHIESLDACIEY